MKVLMITTMFPTPVESYNGISIYQTLAHLKKLDYEFKVLYPVPYSFFPLNLFTKNARTIYSKIPSRWVFGGFEVLSLRFLQFPHMILFHLLGKILWFCAKKKMLRIARDFQPDLIWAQPALPCGYAAMMLSKHLRGKPYIIVVHGLDINTAINIPKARIKISKVYNNAHKVIAVSQKIYEGIIKVAPDAKTAIIPNGIDLDEVIGHANDAGKSKGDIENNEIVITSISNLADTKGLDYNLYALKKVMDKFPNIRYLIIGDGDQLNKLRSLALKLGLDDKVEFLGRMEHSDAMRILSQSDIFSLPSFKEGFGLVYLEAMASGIPVIGCEGEGITDFVQDGVNGFLVKPEDVDSLAQVWMKLIENPELRKSVGEAGRKTVIENYTWDKIIQKYDKVFREVVGLAQS